jgi:hypothetical protein
MSVEEPSQNSWAEPLRQPLFRSFCCGGRRAVSITKARLNEIEVFSQGNVGVWAPQW